MYVHFAVTFTQCALALGYNARQIILNHHYVSEVWSDKHEKWVLMDVEAAQKEGWNRHGTALYADAETREPNRLEVTLDTVTPNLQAFLYLLNGGQWNSLHGEGDDPHSRRAHFTWTLQWGLNVLEVKPRNAFGGDGILSKVVVKR